MRFAHQVGPLAQATYIGAVGDNDSLPVFPLGMVLYPGVLLPLHIFEERYRRLVRDLLDLPDEERIFGVVAIKEGREVGAEGVSAMHEIGCTAQLRYAEAYQDGRFDIIATGLRRFRLLDLERPGDAILDDPVRPGPLRGTIRVLTPEFPGGTDESVGLRRRVARAFIGYRAALLDAQGLDEANRPDPPELPEDPGELGYLVAAAMVLDLADKQVLLAAPTVDERLRLELTLLRRESAMVSGLSLRPAVELPRMPYANN